MAFAPKLTAASALDLAIEGYGSVRLRVHEGVNGTFIASLYYFSFDSFDL